MQTFRTHRSRHIFGQIGPRRRVWSIIGLLFLLSVVFLASIPYPQPVAADGVVLLDETFAGRTTSGWRFVQLPASDPACLTAADLNTTTPGSIPGCLSGSPGNLPDFDGEGTLRLTRNTRDQAAAVWYDTPISSDRGLRITFDMFVYNGTDADGISVFLIDGKETPTTAGAFGGSLGYAQREFRGARVPGIEGGYVGIGFDEWGNFANDSEGRGTACPVGNQSPFGTTQNLIKHTVTLRGAGNDLNGYCWLDSYQLRDLRPGLTLSFPGVTQRTDDIRRRVRMTLSPSPGNRVSVDMDFFDGQGFVNIIPPYDLNTAPNQPAFPETFKLGFAAATGDNTNIHEIRNLRVTTVPPDLSITKQAVGDFTVGQNGTYTLSVTNAASAGPAASPITVKDTLPPGLTFVTASGTGWSCSANGQEVSCTFTPTPNAPVGAGATLPPITLTVKVAAPAFPQVTNTATVDTPDEGDPNDNTTTTITTVNGAPVLIACKAVALAIDADRNNTPSPGDTLAYTIEITNSGSLPAAGTTYTDTPDSNTALVAGSVQASQGNVLAGPPPVNVSIGGIPAGGGVTIAYQTIVNESLPEGVTIVSNQGAITGNNFSNLLTDDCGTPEPNDPTRITVTSTGGTTAITLESFTVKQQGGTVVVRWVTSAEINTLGFHLYRSTEASRENAVRVTPDLILGQGRGQQGATYTWTDTNVTAGVTYTYWLQEVETDGTVSEYGPATTGGPQDRGNRVFLPVLTR